MLTLKDCLALADLSEDEILAIAEHEHLPEIAALELGQYLVHTPPGAPAIRRMILDDIAAAEKRGDRMRVLTLKLVLKRFCECHPEALAAVLAEPSTTRAPRRVAP
jgi:hypothetical protein